MDDNQIHQPGYFESMCEQIDALDPKSVEGDKLLSAPSDGEKGLTLARDLPP